MFARHSKTAVDSSVKTPAARPKSHAVHSADSLALPVWAQHSTPPLVFQTSLEVNQPGDAYEQEADRVAGEVMRMADVSPRLQRCACGGAAVSGGECAECREERLGLQRAAGHAPSPREAPPIVHDVLRTPGQPLDHQTRGFMEAGFGQDFGPVRVHTDAFAAQSARAVSAKAYTVGPQIVFGAGQYVPGTRDGRTLIAHELAHVVQQGASVISRVARDDLDAGVPTGPQDAGLPGGVSTPASGPAPAPTGPAPAPAGPPAPTVSSCSTTNLATVRSAVADARVWADDAVPKIRDFQRGTASPAVATVVTRALNDNFHTTAAGDVATIATNMESLRTALNGTLDIECVSSWWCDPGDLAYVRGRFAWIRRLMDVNLCPFFFSCSNALIRPTTIVHEVAHQYPGAEDNAYEDRPAYATLSASDAMDNADSYAVGVRQVYHSGAQGPGLTC